MSYKPDEATLAAYMYGELSQEEELKVEEYLNAHPETKKEVEEIQSVQHIMGKLQDKEVTTPSFVFEDAPTVVLSRGGSDNRFLRSALAIAASITLLMLVGYFTKLNMGISNGGFQLSFGEQVQKPVNVDEETMKNWMQETLAQNNQGLINKINQLETDLNDKTRQNDLKSSSTQLANYKVDQNVIDQYVSQIKIENRDIILSLMDVSNRDQRQYMDELMTDFAKFLDQQRQADLELIEGHITRIANNVDANQIDEYQASEE